MAVILVDTHAHLCSESFSGDLEEVLRRAAARGVLAVLAVSETLADAQENLALASRHPMVKPCAGLHPEVLDEGEAAEMLAFILENRDRLAAIGEVGLDYWIAQDAAQRELQRKIFAQHIALAKQLELPMTVHSRSAGRHAIALLREHHAKNAVLHAFDGKASSAAEGLDAGYYFSVPPSVVRSPQKQKLIRHLPMERLLLESDSPVLGPDREERNEPANVRIACEQIAAIKGLPVDDVARITTENARSLFPCAFP
jgi:TatD DNase family protein